MRYPHRRQLLLGDTEQGLRIGLPFNGWLEVPDPAVLPKCILCHLKLTSRFTKSQWEQSFHRYIASAGTAQLIHVQIDD